MTEQPLKPEQAPRAEQAPKKEVELLDAFVKPLVDKTEEMWAQVFSQVLGSEKFAEAMGQALKGQLLAQRAIQEQLDRYFKALNLPTRTDLEAIARDLGELKARVQVLDTRLGALPSAAARSRARAEGGAEVAGAP